MKASISTNAVTNDLTITIEGLNWEDLQQASFYAGEVQVRELLKVIGQELTLQLLRSKDVTTPTLQREGQTYYRKAATLGHYQTLYGEVALSRHCYQTSAGGATLCPLECTCQLSFRSATPLLAEVVSFKLASQTASEAAQDLAKSQGVVLSATYLHHLAQQVGQLAMDKHTAWHLQTTAAPASVAIIATGVEEPQCRWSTKRTRKLGVAPSPSMIGPASGSRRSTSGLCPRRGRRPSPNGSPAM